MTRRLNATAKRRVLERDQGLCRYCGKSPATTVDHVIPRSKGGSDSDRNLVGACAPCNTKKRDRTPEDAGMVLLKPGTMLLVKGAEYFGNDHP